MSTSLYDLAADYKVAAEQLADMEADEQTITDTLAGLAGTLEAKAINVALFAMNLEATAKAIKEAETNMAARRKALENRAERVRQYIKDNMEAVGIQKIECPYFKIAIQNNPPSVVVEDEDKIPLKFFTVPEPPPLVLDKKQVAAAIKAGEEVPGAWLKQGTRLVIK